MDNINLINRKSIVELFSIYKEVKLLFVKDDTFSYNSIIEDSLSHIKEEKFLPNFSGCGWVRESVLREQ